MDTIANLWGNVWPILVSVLVFLVVIMIHEFGHFIMAKALGVRVNEYAIGFGPSIFKWKGKETQYSLRIIPFGGYCAMEGEDSESTDDRGFCNKAPWRRFLIIIAGAAFNLILGWILVFFILLPQDLIATSKVAGFIENESFKPVSCNYGLKEGDEIYRVDGRRIYSTIDLSYAFSGVKDGSVDIVVIRDGEKVKLDGVKFDTKYENEDAADEKDKGVQYIVVDFKVYGEENNFPNLIKATCKTSFSYARGVWFSLVDIIRGRFRISQMSGPVGMAAAMSQAAKAGISDFLPLIALITINLGVFNLLPIPSLDGSRALFILIEMIFRKPVPRKVEALVHAVGLGVLLLFILVITVKDIWQFF